MQAKAASLWAPRLAALCVTALLGASLVAWALRWPETGMAGQPGAGRTAADIPSASSAMPPSTPAPDNAAVSKALGATVPVAPGTTETPSAQRFRLTGLLALAPQGGAALIAVQDQPPRAFHVGAKVADGMVLQSVGLRSVALGPDLHSPPSLTLELPVPPDSKP